MFKEELTQKNFSSLHGRLWLPLLALSATPLLYFVRWQWILPFTKQDSPNLYSLAVLDVLALIGLVLAVGRAFTVIKNRKIAQLKSVKLAYTQALEQLRSGAGAGAGVGEHKQSDIEIRLGAIYTLEKLAHTHRELNPTIIEILANYVREHACLTPYKDRTPSDSTRIDIQTAMTVLGRRKISVNEPSLNLYRVYLPSINLQGANLQNINLMGADLRDADLTQAKLQGASLFNSNLLNTNLLKANLKEADLTATKGLSSEQLTQAKQWKAAFRDPELACGANIPQFKDDPVAVAMANSI